MPSSFQSEVVADIRDPCLSNVSQGLKVFLLCFLAYEVVYKNAHLDKQALDGFVITDVSMLTDEDFNVTLRSDYAECESRTRAVDTLGKPFDSTRYVNLMSSPGIGYDKPGAGTVYVKLYNEVFQKRRPPCHENLGVVAAAEAAARAGSDTRGCEAMQHQAPLTDVFPERSNATQIIVMGWERYILYVGQSLFLPPHVADRIDTSYGRREAWLVRRQGGERVPIKFASATGPLDYRDALPKARSNTPLRSEHWEFDYFPITALMDAAGVDLRRFCASEGRGETLRVMIRYSNSRPWQPLGQRTLDYDVTVSRAATSFPMYSSQNDGSSEIIVWSSGLTIQFLVSGEVSTFDFMVLATFLATWFTYTLIAGAVVRQFLIYFPDIAHTWPMTYCSSCLSNMSWFRQLLAATMLYRSILLARHGGHDEFVYVTALIPYGPVEVVCDPRTMEITEIPLESALSGWNLKNPHQVIRPGDFIIQVNGVHRNASSSAVLAELQTCEPCCLTVERLEPDWGGLSSDDSSESRTVSRRAETWPARNPRAMA